MKSRNDMGNSHTKVANPGLSSASWAHLTTSGQKGQNETIPKETITVHLDLLSFHSDLN